MRYRNLTTALCVMFLLLATRAPQAQVHDPRALEADGSTREE
jgi:hypothetical protein